MRGLPVLVVALLAASVALQTIVAHNVAPKQSQEPPTLESILRSINWTKVVHGRLEIYRNGKLVEVVNPDPFTKNIMLYFTNLAYLVQGIAPSQNLLPITVNGTRQDIGLKAYSSWVGCTMKKSSVRFFLSSAPAPSNIWNQYSLGSYVLEIDESAYTYGFNSTDAWFTVTGWTEVQNNYTIQSIYIVAHTHSGDYCGGTFNDFLLAIEPVNLSITQGDNVTISWHVDIKIDYTTSNGYRVFLRNLAALVIMKIIGETRLAATDNTFQTTSELGVWSGTPSVCVVNSTYTVFNPNPGGVCKKIRTYYSSLKNLGDIYNIFYSNEINRIGTIYIRFTGVNPSAKKDYVLMEVTNLNVNNNNEVVASIVVPGG